jgi:hypothetical protein
MGTGATTESPTGTARATTTMMIGTMAMRDADTARQFMRLAPVAARMDTSAPTMAVSPLATAQGRVIIMADAVLSSMASCLCLFSASCCYLLCTSLVKLSSSPTQQRHSTTTRSPCSCKPCSTMVPLPCARPCQLSWAWLRRRRPSQMSAETGLSRSRRRHRGCSLGLLGLPLRLPSR